MRAALAALVAAALLVAGASAQGFCEGEGWEALAPEDVAPEVLNVTVTEFNKQFVPSEENPDDGQRPVWVPCDAGILESEVEAACLRVDGEGASYQLRVGLNCTLATPVPNSNVAAFEANVTMGAEADTVTFADVEILLDEALTRNTECTIANCAACEQADKCDACMPDYVLDNNSCAMSVGDGATLLAPGAVGAGLPTPIPGDKDCPLGWYVYGFDPYNRDGSVNCVQCTRAGCTDCAWCQSPPMANGWCWNNQQCATFDGSRYCLQGYYFKFGGCSQCSVTIPNCAFCDACTGGTGCINGAKCNTCKPGYKLGPNGYCPKA